MPYRSPYFGIDILATALSKAPNMQGSKDGLKRLGVEP
jgi:hypothetical protein